MPFVPAGIIATADPCSIGSNSITFGQRTVLFRVTGGTTPR